MTSLPQTIAEAKRREEEERLRIEEEERKKKKEDQRRKEEEAKRDMEQRVVDLAEQKAQLNSKYESLMDSNEETKSTLLKEVSTRRHLETSLAAALSTIDVELQVTSLNFSPLIPLTFFPLISLTFFPLISLTFFPLASPTPSLPGSFAGEIRFANSIGR